MIGKQISELNATQLGLLRHADFVDFDAAMEVSERKQYVSSISGLMEILRKELKWAEVQQLRHIGETAENWEQVLIGRGGINSLNVLLERWESMNTEHMVNIKPKDKAGVDFDPHLPIAES